MNMENLVVNFLFFTRQTILMDLHLAKKMQKKIRGVIFKKITFDNFLYAIKNIIHSTIKAGNLPRKETGDPPSLWFGALTLFFIYTAILGTISGSFKRIPGV